MSSVSWSANALSDLDAIKLYLSEHAPNVVDDFLTRLLLSTRKLETFPDIGSILDATITPPIRQIHFPPFRIIYRVTDGTPQILRIYHYTRRLGPDVYTT